MKASTILALGAAVLLAAACSRTGKSEEPVSAPREATATEASLPDARSEYESRGLLPDAPRGLGEASAYLAAPGEVLAGPIATGRPDAPLVAAFREGRGASIAVLGASWDITATAALPGPPLELAVFRSFVLASCADGSLIGFALGDRVADGSVGAPTIALEERWRRREAPVDRLIVLPANRAAAALEDGTVSVFDLVSGAQAWRSDLGFLVSDIAYARGSVVACGDSVAALSEEGGAVVWKVETPEPGRLLAAGDGMVALVDGRGRLSFFEAKDGRVVATVAGPFDAAIRPVLDSGSCFAALPGGGAARVDCHSGETVREWRWRGAAAFLTADEGAIYSSAGAALLARDRYADSPGRDIALPSPARGAPVGLEGGQDIFALGCDGGIAVVGQRGSFLDSLLAPPAEIAVEIEGALAGLGGTLGELPPPRYGPFVPGVPVYPSDGFAVLRYRPEKSGKRVVAATPDPGDAIIALFDGEGKKLGSNVDELGSPGRIAQWFAAGATYWIAAGGRGSGEYRLSLR